MATFNYEPNHVHLPVTFFPLAQNNYQFVNLIWFENNQYFYSAKFENKVIDENEKLTFPGYGYGSGALPNVQAVLFMNCKMTKIPQKLTESFRNLRVMSISKCNIKCLSKDDLAEYKNLEHFLCNGNKIEFLPGDLFENFDKLESISFFENNLKFIEPNIFDGLEKLKYADFRKNPNYNFRYCENLEIARMYDSYEGIAKQNLKAHTFPIVCVPLFRDNATEPLKFIPPTLQEVKIDLYNKFCQRFSNIHNPATPKIQFSSSIKSQHNLLDDLESLTQDETFKDFKIIIDDREFPVHKFVLAARSPTLAEMLRNNPEAKNLKLVDISVRIFELILTFLYTDEFPSEDGTNFMHLFIAAGRLELTDLKNYAAVKLFDAINAENALEILNLSNKYGQDELRQKAFDEIKKTYLKIEFKDEWAKDGDKMLKIIEAFKAREEIIRKADEEFKKLLN